MITHKEYWDDVPPLGRVGRRWLHRRLYLMAQHWLKKQAQVDPEDPENAQLVEILASDLAARPLSVLRWVDTEKFSGRGFSSGHYVLKEDVVLRLLPEVFAATAQRLDATDFPSLEKWLDALDRNVLYSPPPEEPSRAQLFKRLGLRVCRDCSTSFAPDYWNRVRCPPCRAAHKGATKSRSV